VKKLDSFCGSNPKAPYRAPFQFAYEGSNCLERDAAARGVSKGRRAFTCKGQEVTEGSSQAAATSSDLEPYECTVRGPIVGIYLCFMAMLSAYVRSLRFSAQTPISHAPPISSLEL
jgi:hypothetical protein